MVLSGDNGKENTHPQSLGKPPPSNGNGLNPDFLDRLDQDFIEYFSEHIATRPATHGITIADLRADPQKYASAWCRDTSNEPFVKDIELTADDGHVFSARCYHPDQNASPFGPGPYPIYINFHGG